VANDEMLECRSSRGVRAATQQQGGGAPTPAAATGGQAPAARAGGGGPQQPQSQNSSSLGRSTNQLGIPDSILHDPSRVREFIRSTPALLFSIESQNPSLYRAVMNVDSIAPFAEMWRMIVSRMEADRAAETERLRLATADPMDPAVQARIEEEIRLKNVQENYEMAMEYNPEVSLLQLFE